MAAVERAERAWASGAESGGHAETCRGELGEISEGSLRETSGVDDLADLMFTQCLDGCGSPVTKEERVRCMPVP